ncbi:hypothetical protein TUE45_03651 [Streptomyces reticuli]|uniref:Uncharacterized protein n=1 Tax=Streptomyces bangladeshensis TaxID=295352 RepID=A0ABN3BDF6_9ACTN|nr:hypothetical protein TUE45_03651 [Streptomyces reticuli]
MMCDTSLTDTTKKSATGPYRVPETLGIRRRTAVTSTNVESTKVIDTGRTGTAAHPQFGPVVDLAYTRWRATW